MRWGRAGVVFRKELLDMFRDRRMIVMMFGVPLVMYPALVLFASQITMHQISKVERKASQVAFANAPDPLLRTWIEGIEHLEIVEPEDPETALREERLDAVVRSEPGLQEALNAGAQVSVVVRYDATDSGGRKALERIEAGLEERADGVLDVRLEALGVTREHIEPVAVEKENTAPPEKSAGLLLGSILPLAIIVMLGLGAFYPAIDLTAGEKERGTFETLLSTPVHTWEVVTGKYLTVCLMSLMTGALNLASMSLTLWFQISQMPDAQDVLNVHVPWHVVLTLLVLLVPLALLVSGVMITLAMFARTLKEAEYYILPFFILILFPALAAMPPGAELNAFTVLIPITNIALLFKELLMGEAGFEAVAQVFISTAAYAALAVQLATWAFRREEVVLSEQGGVPLTLRRGDFVPRTAPTPGMALGLYAAVLLLIFYLGSYAQSRHLIGGLFFTQLALILGPTVLLLWFTRVDLRTGLNLRPMPWAAAAGTALMAVGWIPLIVQFSCWHQRVLPMPEEMAAFFEQLLQGADAPLPVMLAVVAVAPAVCEEALFRGAILSGFRGRLKPWMCVVVVGGLFGILHMSIYRIIPTAVTGMALTYVVVRSGSIYAGMALHFVNNAFGVLAMSERLPETLRRHVDLEALEQHGVPPAVLAGAVACFVAGVAVMEWSARRSSPARRAKENDDGQGIDGSG